jgi:hypothetical protein
VIFTFFIARHFIIVGYISQVFMDIVLKIC